MVTRPEIEWRIIMPPTAHELGQVLFRLEQDFAKRPLKERVEINAADAMRLIALLRQQGVHTRREVVQEFVGPIVKRGGQTYRNAL